MSTQEAGSTVLGLVPGQIFAGEYRIVEPLGRGGMGVVYAAEQLSSGRKRALKLLSGQIHDERTFPWGNDPPKPKQTVCWNPDATLGDPTAGTCPVGTHPEGNTPQGLKDMAGNVAEWTSTPEDCDSALGCLENGTHLVAGGFSNSGLDLFLRIDFAMPLGAGLPPPSAGFRCAKSIP